MHGRTEINYKKKNIYISRLGQSNPDRHWTEDLPNMKQKHQYHDIQNTRLYNCKNTEGSIIKGTRFYMWPYAKMKVHNQHGLV
jgi:hypothetical protein